jgi:hypothetical protein
MKTLLQELYLNFTPEGAGHVSVCQEFRKTFCHLLKKKFIFAICSVQMLVKRLLLYSEEDREEELLVSPCVPMANFAAQQGFLQDCSYSFIYSQKYVTHGSIPI